MTTPNDGQSHMVYVSGSNKRGQLGSEAFGDQINQFAPVAEDSTNDSLYSGNICDIQCSWHNTLILTEEAESGKLHCYITGDNKYGQLALGDKEQEPETRLQLRCDFESLDRHFTERSLKSIHSMTESFIVQTETRTQD